MKGEILYGNDDYFKLMGQSSDELSPVRFIDAIHRNSRSQAQTHWNHVVSGQPHRVELRLNRPYEDFDQSEQLEMDEMDLESWVLMSSVPIKDGAIVQGLMMDISRQKWMENLQRRKMVQAIERRRQQENFMDIIAHEARNPLSAITLCTDNILATLQDVLKRDVTLSRDTVVLTLSKLDAGLLAIAPSKVQPREVLRQAMKMFEGDLQQADIDLSYNVDQSFADLAVDWVDLDPGRMLQILINLVTNAIKFTKTQKTRNITVTLSASLEPPNRSLVRYLESNHIDNDSNDASSYAHHESVVYIAVTVADSGCGIEESSLQKLFHRWQQASPKTYTEYGGSGLGLFISRELAKLQGGNIGVASEYGRGSTFEFYVRALKCTPLVHGRSRSPSNNSPRATERKRTRHTHSREHVHDSIAGDSGHNAEESDPEVLHLLLVEDNLINQKVMFNQLVRAGHKVTIANHGVEALEHIRKTRPYTPQGEPLDIVLMDVEVSLTSVDVHGGRLMHVLDAGHGWHRMYETDPRHGITRGALVSSRDPRCDGECPRGTTERYSRSWHGLGRDQAISYGGVTARAGAHAEDTW
nr:histidine kinase 5 [Quercus suber]